MIWGWRAILAIATFACLVFQVVWAVEKGVRYVRVTWHEYGPAEYATLENSVLEGGGDNFSQIGMSLLLVEVEEQSL